MTWTTTDLKAALNSITDKSNLTAVAAVLNAQLATPTTTYVDIKAYEVEALLSQTGEIGHLLDLAADPATAMAGWTYPTGVTAALVRAVVRNMLNVIQSPRLQVFATSSDAGYTAVAQGLGLLVAVGLLSADTQSRLIAMTVPKPGPKWVPAINVGDIQSVLGQYA